MTFADVERASIGVIDLKWYHVKRGLIYHVPGARIPLQSDI